MAGSGRRLSVLLVIVVAVLLDGVPWAVEAQQFSLTHRYANLEESPARSGGNGTVSQEYFEKLVAHDRRRLASFVTFDLKGSYFATSLYYTQISLGTPPRQYNVFVDTGSDLTWVNCAPCTNCPSATTIEGVTLTKYDPALSSSEKVLPCASNDCQIISQTNNPECTDPISPNACPYDVKYLDGSGTNGYILKDLLTFNLVVNGTSTASTANVYFGCGHNASGSLQSETSAVDGLMGLGTASVTIPNQIAPQKNTSRAFAHCLQGSDVGGGVIVMGNITEPGVVYTPMVPDQPHFNIVMQNIAVNGVNITTPATFDLVPISRGVNIVGYSGGVIVDSGSTHGLLVQAAYDEFVAAVVRNAPAAATVVKVPQHPSFTCFSYVGPPTEFYPNVTLFFNGGAVMNLTPRNYMRNVRLSSAGDASCIVWASSEYTILGDIVLQDQLVVHDIDNQRVGWIQNFNCSKSISMGSSTYTAPSAPGGSGGSSSGLPATRMSIYSSCCSCLAVAAFLLSNLL